MAILRNPELPFFLLNADPLLILYVIQVLYAMPLLTLTFSVNFPAAINLYWLTNNILSVIQAKVIR